MLIGSKSDPAGIKGTKDVAPALQRIKDEQAPFISRGDRSGTHIAEINLWNKAAGIDIEKEKALGTSRLARGWAPHSIPPVPAMPMCVGSRDMDLIQEQRRSRHRGERRQALFNQYGVIW